MLQLPRIFFYIREGNVKTEMGIYISRMKHQISMVLNQSKVFCIILSKIGSGKQKQENFISSPSQPSTIICSVSAACFTHGSLHPSPAEKSRS